MPKGTQIKSGQIEQEVSVGISGAELIHSASATGATPLLLTTTGVQEGDVVVVVEVTRNSAAGVISGGSGVWEQLWHEETGTDEEVRVYWKLVTSGSEPATYSFTHATGVTAIAAIVIYRGLDGSLIHYGDNVGRYTPSILGSLNGLHILIMSCCYQGANLALVDPLERFNVDISYTNNDQGVIIGSRDSQFPAGMPSFGFTGGDSGFAVAGTIVIE